MCRLTWKIEKEVVVHNTKPLIRWFFSVDNGAYIIVSLSTKMDSHDGKGIHKRAKRHAWRTRKTYRFDPRHGKGSHGMLYVGDRRTTVKQGEFAAGTFRNMLQQLDIAKEEF